MSQEFHDFELPDAQDSRRVRLLENSQILELVNTFYGKDEPIGKLDFSFNRLELETTDAIIDQELETYLRDLELAFPNKVTGHGITVVHRNNRFTVLDDHKRPMRHFVYDLNKSVEGDEPKSIKVHDFYYFVQDGEELCLEITTDGDDYLISEALYKSQFCFNSERFRKSHAYIYNYFEMNPNREIVQVVVTASNGNDDGSYYQKGRFERKLEGNWEEISQEVWRYPQQDNDQIQEFIRYNQSTSEVLLHWVEENDTNTRSVYCETLKFNQAQPNTDLLSLDDLLRLMQGRRFGTNRHGSLTHFMGIKVDIDEHGNATNPCISYEGTYLEATVISLSSEWLERSSINQNTLGIVARISDDQGKDTKYLIVIVDTDFKILKYAIDKQAVLFPTSLAINTSKSSVPVSPGFVM